LLKVPTAQDIVAATAAEKQEVTELRLTSALAHFADFVGHLAKSDTYQNRP
jgi:hypothetical protein